MNFFKKEAANGFVNDPGTGGEEQEGLEKSREVFDLAVAVAVLFIGWPARHTHRKQRHDGRDKIQSAVSNFRQDAQAAGHDADDQLEQGEKDRCNN